MTDLSRNKKHQQDQYNVKRGITLYFHYVTSTKPGFDFQGTVGAIDLEIKIKLPVSQVIFNSTFELYAFCGNLLFGFILMVLYLISSN